ncbi:MAG TPA: site-2 protease family protein [Pyrinomonadaceae bacterium]|jgi:Zn-dependent protease
MSFLKTLRRTIQVARVYGIPVRIDYRWFIVSALSVWLIATTLQSGPHRFSTMVLPPLAPLAAWFLGFATTIALFFSVFGHELSHALMGRAEGIEIEEIVLHPFGGFTRLRRDADNPRAEFRIAVAGPAASFLIGVLAFVAAWLATLLHYNTTVALFAFVGSGNVLLAVFNLFPGYPLDGGRVLRAIIWRSRGDMIEATRIAGFCGALIAATLIVFGVYMALNFARLAGLWSVLVGLFLLDSAVRIVKYTRAPKQATVADLMGAPFSIEPDLLISHFVDSVLPLHRQTSFPVARDGRLHGILSLEDLKALPRARWHITHAREVMRPVAPQLFTEPSTPAARADELMQSNGVGSLAVVNHAGQLIGFLQKRAVKTKG